MMMPTLVVWGDATGCSQSPRQERQPLASRKVHLPLSRTAVTCPTSSAPIASWQLSPRLVDAILATRVGFEPQKTEEPKSEDAPDNLFVPIDGHDTAKDGFRALPRSLFNWLETHPTVKRTAAAGAALGALALLRGRGSK
jgi:hypothetical protein